MARKLSQSDPALAIEFFLSGFYTHRSQLFAPFKSIGINVVSFHDPVIDGANMEDTDLYEWQRRPGFSIFCPTQLDDNEIVNQFYSSRVLTGAVVPWVDTTKRWATFSSTALTTIALKTTTAQGYVSTIGNKTYFSDGAPADLYKFDGANLSAWGLAAPTVRPIASGLGFWQPHTHFKIGDSILDPNGSVESVSSILIPSGAFGSPTSAATLALGGSLSGSWVFDPIRGGYIFAVGYQHIQQQSVASLTSTASFTFPSQVTSGHVIVLAFSNASTNGSAPMVTSVTDSQGNTYTQQATKAGTFTGGGNSFISTSWIYTATAGSTGPCTVTVTLSRTEIQLLGHEFSGISPTISQSANNYTALPVSSFNSGTVTFAGTALVFSLLDLNGNISIGVKPTGYIAGASSLGTTIDAFSGTTSPQSPTWAILSPGGQSLGITVVFPISPLATGYSPYLFLGGLGLNIPLTATILGIKLSIPKLNAALGAVVDQSVKLVVGGAVSAGGSDEPSLVPWSQSGYSTIIYGGPTETWGTLPGTPTVAQLNAAGFGFAISANITDVTGGSVIPEVGFTGANQPTVTVYYTLASGTSGPGISGTTEPTWATAIARSVNDGGLTWTNYGPIQTWIPATGYSTPVVILDGNGNLQLSTHLANPVPAWDVAATYSTIGQVVYFGGQYWINLLASNLGITPSTAYATTGGSVNAPAWALTLTPVVTGLIEPVWNTTVGGTTADGSYTWTNIGQGSGLAFTGYAYVYGYRTIYGHLTTSSPFSNNTGAILGPLNATITSFTIDAFNVATFVGDNNFLPGNVFTVLGLGTSVGMLFNGQSFTVISAVPSETFPLTQVAVDGSNVVTIAAVNNLVPGQTVTFSGIGTATFLNGITVTVLTASSSQFTANFTHALYGVTSDTGNVNVPGSYTASTPLGPVALTPDSGEAMPLISTVTGVGTSLTSLVGPPLCNSTAAITSVSVTANIVTITASNNFQDGLWVTLTGLTNATFLNNQQLQVISVDKPVGTQNTSFQVYFETPDYVAASDTGLATFNAIEIYRISDGGGIYLFVGAVTNPGTGRFQFNDFVPDANLDILLVAPLGHQNDPPPGAPGSIIKTTGTIIAYWQGRLWIANGNYVYFTAGPDCSNGVPEESCPPGNRFQFAGPVLSLIPTADGVGLLVHLADRVAAILGGPETISFYPVDFLSNFGISNPNAIFRDGSVIGQFTTQKQYIELLGVQKNDIGEHIGDYLAANFKAEKSYVTMHRDGLDVGVFVSNGVDRIVRYGSNISAWSVPAFPTFGAGALQSVETSVGVMSLMLAAPAGSITSSIGPVNPTSSISVAGAGTAWLTPGNIVAGNPTSYATVTFIAAGSSQVLRVSAYPIPPIPLTAIVQGVKVSVIGKQSDISGDLMVTITPTNPALGAETHTFSFGLTNTTVVFGGLNDLWGMNWSIPNALNAGALSFDITSAFTCSPPISGSRIFNGTSDVITLGPSASLDTIGPNLTLMAWVYQTVNSVGPYGIWEIGVGRDMFLVLFSGGALGGNVAASITTASSSFAGAVPLNTWTHVAMSYNDSGDRLVHLFVNGTEVTPGFQLAADGVFFSNPGAPSLIGDDGYGERFQGNIAEARAYNTTLTPTQIAAIAANTTGDPNAGGAAANLIAYLHLCGLTSPEPDASGHSNIGVLTGTTTGTASPGYGGCGGSCGGSGFPNPHLGSAGTYAILASAGVTNTGATIISGGNVGSFPTNTIIGLTGANYIAPAATVTATAQNQTDLTAAFVFFNGLTSTAIGASFATHTFTATSTGYNGGPGFVGKASSTLHFTGGIITLDGANLANPVFVFQVVSALNIDTAATTIALVNGAKADNVIWVVGSAATFDAHTHVFIGNILATSAVTLNGGSLAGRALVTTGPVIISSATSVTATGSGTTEVDISEVQVTITYQNPGNYLYARDVNSWGDGGTYGANNGQPYLLCNVVIGSISLSQLGAPMFPLQHVVGYFDAVGTLNNGGPSYPDIWILPNEVSDKAGVGFVYLPEIIQEPPEGQNQPSASMLALRWPLNMVNSQLMSQFIHHLQVKIQFEPENAPNTLKAISFKENQD